MEAERIIYRFGLRRSCRCRAEEEKSGSFDVPGRPRGKQCLAAWVLGAAQQRLADQVEVKNAVANITAQSAVKCRNELVVMSP